MTSSFRSRPVALILVLTMLFSPLMAQAQSDMTDPAGEVTLPPDSTPPPEAIPPDGEVVPPDGEVVPPPDGEAPPSGTDSVVGLDDGNIDSALLGGTTPAASLFSGSLSYAIPIALPPGRGGIAPKIALKYNSFLKNGPLGVGWTLDLGSISRAVKEGLRYEENAFTLSMDGSSS